MYYGVCIMYYTRKHIQVLPKTFDRSNLQSKS